MRRLNILFSTTRQWNCGDEFILFGVRRLLDDLGVSYNAILYNRHPSINPRRFTRKRPWSRSEPLPDLDNSFFLDDVGLVDYAIFAGSPEWFGGPRVTPLLRFLLANRIRCAFLGVGVHRPHAFGEELRRVMGELCDLVTARDPVCFDLVREFPNAYYEVCPALFSAPRGRQRSSTRRVGVVIQASKTAHHSLPGSVLERTLERFERLESAFPTTYIAHYIDDLKLAQSLGKDVLYSAYAEDYAALFDRFDVVLSTRIHGCGIAASLAIPNVLIPHDGRYQTALKFGSSVAEPDGDLAEIVDAMDVRAKSSELIAHRAACQVAYGDLMTRHMSILQ